MNFVLHSYRKYTNRAKGAAIVEFIVSLLFIIPLFISLPVIAKYLAIKHKNIESGRYAIWEKTVWSSYSGQWKDNENIKPDKQLEIELDTRFYGSQIHGLANRNPTRNQFWVDFNSESMIERSNNKRKVTLNNAIDYSPVENKFADEIAYGGHYYTNNSPMHLDNNCLDSVAGSKGSNLNLGAHTFSRIEVTANVKGLMMPGVRMHDVQNHVFKYNGAILSNAWIAPTGEVFNERVASLSMNEQVKCIVQPAQYISKLPIYREGKISSELGDWDLSVITERDN